MAFRPELKRKRKRTTIDDVSTRLAVGRAKPAKVSAYSRQTIVDEEIRILIVHDHPLTREGIRSVFKPQPHFRVVGAAADRDEAVRLGIEFVPDIALVDLASSAIEVIRDLKRTVPRTKIIVCTSQIDQTNVLTLLGAGARGFLEKAVTAELLFKSIRLVHQGQLWLNREIVTAVMDQLTLFPERPFLERSDFGLTPREREIVRRVAAGETNKKIAQLLSIGQDTVKHHLTSVFNKTATANRLELAVFAIGRGLA